MAKKYHIRELEEVTGIKVHTIRMWEKRYNLLTPERSDTNIRFYNESTFKKFLLIAQLYYNNFKISEIAKFSLKDLQEKALMTHKSDGEYLAWENELLQSITNFDNKLFDTIVRDTIFTLDLYKTIVFILIPFFKKIDTYWKANSLTFLHRQFAHEKITKILYSAISGIERYTKTNNKRVVLFTNSDDINQLILLFADLVLKRMNLNTILMKNITDHESVFSEIASLKSKTIFTIAPLNKKELLLLIDKIKTNKDIKFFVLDTNYVLDYNISNLTIINNLEEIEDEVII